MSIEKDKEVEFYSAIVNAWLNTRLELDKSLLTLAASGIGLLITLLTAVGIKAVVVFVLYVFALISFMLCLLSVLWVLKHNSTHIERVVAGTEIVSPLLVFLDRAAAASFLVGVLFSAAIGIYLAAQSLLVTEPQMTEKKVVSSHGTFDSVNGVSSMRPVQSDLTRSFSGVTQLKPPQPASSQPVQSSPAPSTESVPAAPAASSRPLP